MGLASYKRLTNASYNMGLNPHLKAGRNVYTLSFRHPVSKDIFTRSLATSDESLAREIALHVERILGDAELLRDPDNPRLLALHERACIVVHGRKPNVDHTLDPAPVEMLVENVEHGKRVRIELPDAREAVLRQRIADLEFELKAVRAERDDAYRRLNRHCVATLQAARAEWEAWYPTNRDVATVQDAFRNVRSFCAFVGEKTLLRDVRGSHVDGWTDTFAAAVSVRSVQRKRAYLSSFFSWAKRRYELLDTPLRNAQPIAGVERIPENIVAIRRLEEIRALFDGLACEPYWQALVATACLAGPRYAELIHIRRADVFLQDGYIRIATRSGGRRPKGTKTGRERNVPIERTLLRPLLEAHLARADASAQPWLFPSQLDAGSVEQTKTLKGTWSDIHKFSEHRQAALLAAQWDAPEELRESPMWLYGPAQWRHTFGTVLGQCGFSSLEIARLMGNSADVCERHYVAVTRAGKRWGLEW